MKRVVAWAITIACLRCFALYADSENIPSVILNPHGDTPVWVAADIAVDHGQLRPELLGRYLTALRDVAQRNGRALASGTTAAGDQGSPLGRPCTVFKSQPPSEHFHPMNVLADLTQHGKAIVSGRVIAIRPGFYNGLPGSLLQLDARWLKGRSSAATYFFYPFAHIETAEGPICARPVGEFTPPQVGDRLIVFSFGRPFAFDGGSVVTADTAKAVVHEPRNHRARFPATLRTLVTEGCSAVDSIHRAVEASLGVPAQR